jgi:hypothetical protein
MKYNKQRHKMIPGIVSILTGAGFTKSNFDFRKAMDLLYSKTNGEDLVNAWLKHQGKVFSQLENFG